MSLAASCSFVPPFLPPSLRHGVHRFPIRRIATLKLSTAKATAISGMEMAKPTPKTNFDTYGKGSESSPSVLGRPRMGIVNMAAIKERGRKTTVTIVKTMIV